MRSIGLHLRFEESFLDVVEKAALCGVTSFQCFFIYGKSGQRIEPTEEHLRQFHAMRERYFDRLFVHGAYWINLADNTRTHHPALLYDIALAKKLSFSHIVLHPGATCLGATKMQGIEAIARSLNSVLKHENDVTLVLENTAHGSRAVGSNIHDFALLLERLDHPEKVRFCIDTAHAYAYGYDITSDRDRADFLLLLERVIGIDAIALLHVNDSKSACGSKIDHHAKLNCGHIKNESLKKFVLEQRLQHIPLILELPNMADAEQAAILQQVREWHR